MDAVAKAPWMGLRRVSEAHKALSLHLTNSCYKVQPEGCGVGLADLPAQDALAEPPWMGLRRVREPNTAPPPVPWEEYVLGFMTFQRRTRWQSPHGRVYGVS